MNLILKSENRNNVTNELLQSEEWMRFQEAAGRHVVRLCGEEWSANGVVHRLPVVGEYLYVPRGPKGRSENLEVRSEDQRLRRILDDLFAKAKEVNAGWIRIEPETEDLLSEIREAVKGSQIVKAPHDMQPRETFVVDLTPTEESLLASMKPKVRYNIRVAEKRGVKVFTSTEPEYRDAFIRLVTKTADRKGISAHPVAYYKAMLETLLGERAILMIAEKNGEICAVNLLTLYGDTATYLHGGSDDSYRADMAPFLLQWEGMRAAKRHGCVWYDFGGVNAKEFSAGEGKWLGITRFKFGFSPTTAPTVFPGTYDIVLSPLRYGAYRMIQSVKNII
jgi:peptidoglycan pentaglycine glycine transferase (the first glycine)